VNIVGMPPAPRERTSLLIVRMWLESTEPTGFRLSVTEIPDLQRQLERTTVFGDVERALDHLTARVRSFALRERDG
jgi:hypothetical protein